MRPVEIHLQIRDNEISRLPTIFLKAHGLLFRKITRETAFCEGRQDTWCRTGGTARVPVRSEVSHSMAAVSPGDARSEGSVGGCAFPAAVVSHLSNSETISEHRAIGEFTLQTVISVLLFS